MYTDIVNCPFFLFSVENVVHLYSFKLMTTNIYHCCNNTVSQQTALQSLTANSQGEAYFCFNMTGIPEYSHPNDLFQYFLLNQSEQGYILLKG